MRPYVALAAPLFAGIVVLVLLNVALGWANGFLVGIVIGLSVFFGMLSYGREKNSDDEPSDGHHSK